MNPAIQTRDLSFAYQDRLVLHDVSVSVDRGEMIGYNPDGSNKPGPNFKPERPDTPLAEDEDDEV